MQNAPREEHSAILSTFIKLPFVLKNFVLSILSGSIRRVLLYMIVSVSIQGYSRKAAALCYLDRYEEAKIAYEEALKLDPDNEQLLKGLEEAESKLTGMIYTEPHYRKIKLNLEYYIYCFINCNAILSKIKTLIHENESKTPSINHSLLIITCLGICLPLPLNGTMISARPRMLIKVTFLKHFALEVWVSI